MLSPLGWIYGKIINKRNSLYESGSLRSTSLGVPTISVGNITVGGTGKTPLVAYIAELLAEKGEKVCIISRGYKRENENERVLVSDSKKILVDVKKAGDEPFELANKLIGKAFVLADANRIAGGIWAKKELGITAFVLDDAFQHLKVKRDLDILTIDATNPFGNRKTLPSGILREPLENLQRADLIIITRANLIQNTQNLISEIKKLNASATIITTQNKISQLIRFKDKVKDNFEVNEMISKKFLAFCALGNPDNFFAQLTTEGIKLSFTKSFKDHHFYTQADIERMEIEASKNNAEAFLTTAKDAVKLSELELSLPYYIVENKMIFDNEKKLREIIYAVF